MLEARTDQRGQERVPPAALRSPARETSNDRAIPPRLAPSLTGSGGLLVALGAVGTWVRATSLPTGTSIPEQVEVIAGTASSSGWILLAVGVLTMAAAVAWVARATRVRAVAAGASLIAIILSSVRLALIDRQAADMAEGAVGTTGLETYHAGYGWGAWLMLLGVVLLALSLLAGGLRELDLRRGR